MWPTTAQSCPRSILLSTGIGLSGAYDINGDGTIDLLGSGTFLWQSSSGAGTSPASGGTSPASGGTSPASSDTALTVSATTVAAGQNVALTAKVTGPSGSSTPTGTVTFQDGTTNLGTGTLNPS